MRTYIKILDSNTRYIFALEQKAVKLIFHSIHFRENGHVRLFDPYLFFPLFMLYLNIFHGIYNEIWRDSWLSLLSCYIVADFDLV